MTFPEDIVNRALDCLGVDEIGDLQEGSKAAKAALRQYGPLIRQLLQAAQWNFARRVNPLVLVADSTAIPPQPVPVPWLYEYLLPSDCVQARFVPNLSAPFITFSTYSPAGSNAGIATVSPAHMSGIINDENWQIQVGTFLTVLDGPHTENVAVASVSQNSFTALFRFDHHHPFVMYGTVPAGTNGVTVPLMTNLTANPAISGMVPMPWQMATDTVVPMWDLSQFGTTSFGLGAPQTVILTNVRSAQLVYTALITDPTLWDSLFAEAFVAALATRIAMQVIDDKKLALAMRNEQIGVAKQTLLDARASNGNEGWTSLNREAVWIQARRGIALRGNDCGAYSQSWTPFALGDGTVF